MNEYLNVLNDASPSLICLPSLIFLVRFPSSKKNNWKISIHYFAKFAHWNKYIVYSFSSDPEGEWKNCQRVLKFLPLIFGSETSKQVKWVRNVRVDYGKVIIIKGKCQKMKGEYQKCAFPQGKITPSIEPRNGE